ncbi:MAG: alpha/beta hydrolase [Alphaproteobacteria bacterium]|nr:alpha/beta hydrolase [Alphaproteobacteria bacterium]
MALAPRERFVRNTNGKRMFVADWGDPHHPRPPILGLPGYSRNAKDFRHLAERLAPRRLVSLDYRGRGRSEYEHDWRAYDPQTLLDDVRHVLIALGLHKVVVVGTSLGGILAMGLAVAAPTALAGVVLNDVGPMVEPAGADYLLDYMGRDRPQNNWNGAIAELRRLLPDLSLHTDDAWRAFAENTFRQGDDGMLHIDWDPAIVKPLTDDTAPAQDLWPLFGALRPIPVLVMRGGKSAVLSADTLAAMQTRHPAMTALTLDGVGHAPTLDEPEARGALDDFLIAH